MTIKPLFQCLAFAAIACCIVIVTLVTVQATEQFISWVADYAGSIDRLVP